jgi:hypothetical protein
LEYASSAFGVEVQVFPRFDVLEGVQAQATLELNFKHPHEVVAVVRCEGE